MGGTVAPRLSTQIFLVQELQACSIFFLIEFLYHHLEGIKLIVHDAIKQSIHW